MKLRQFTFYFLFSVVFTFIFFLICGPSVVNLVKTFHVTPNIGVGNILCVVPLSQQSLADKAAAVRDTWAKRCDKTLFFGPEPDPSFPVIKLNHVKDHSADYLPAKMFAIFQYIHDHHLNDFDWLMKADDDTYVIVENLRRLLRDYDSNDLIHFGHQIVLERGTSYPSGGAGYVLSHAALEKLITHIKGEKTNSILCHRRMGAEDVAVSECLQSLGVKLVPSVDEHGLETFHPFSVSSHLFGEFPSWYRDYRNGNLKKGAECCSKYSITYHFVEPTFMYVMDHLLYNTKVENRN